MFEPCVVARILGLEYELRDSSGAIDSRNAEAAGVLNRQRETISISSRFDYFTQRFTAGHELGHFVLHPNIGNVVEHRDRPIFEMAGWRPPHEAEADYFSACCWYPGKRSSRSLRSDSEPRSRCRTPRPSRSTWACR